MVTDKICSIVLQIVKACLKTDFFFFLSMALQGHRGGIVNCMGGSKVFAEMYGLLSIMLKQLYKVKCLYI